MAHTMPADMKGGKRAPTATTSKAIGKAPPSIRSNLITTPFYFRLERRVDVDDQRGRRAALLVEVASHDLEGEGVEQ